jgi:hypothetical protein
MLDLLPLLAGRGLRRADQEEQLGRVDGIARDAAAAALLGRVEPEVVPLLEQGRVLLLGRVLEVGTEVDRLARRCPGLAARLRTVSRLLAAEPGPSDRAAPFVAAAESLPPVVRRA